jgi:hypothetical protein
MFSGLGLMRTCLTRHSRSTTWSGVGVGKVWVVPRPDYRIGVPEASWYREVLNSDTSLSLRTQRADRIDSGRPARRQIAGQQGRRHQHGGHRSKRDRIYGAGFEEQRPHQTCERDGATPADHHTDTCQRHRRRHELGVWSARNHAAIGTSR